MIRVLIVEDQRMAREDMENYIQSSGRYSLEAFPALSGSRKPVS